MVELNKNRSEPDSQTESLTTAWRQPPRFTIVLAISRELHRHWWEISTSLVAACRPKAHWLSTAMTATHI